MSDSDIHICSKNGNLDGLNEFIAEQVMDVNYIKTLGLCSWCSSLFLCPSEAENLSVLYHESSFDDHELRESIRQLREIKDVSIPLYHTRCCCCLNSLSKSNILDVIDRLELEIKRICDNDNFDSDDNNTTTTNKNDSNLKNIEVYLEINISSIVEFSRNLCRIAVQNSAEKTTSTGTIHNTLGVILKTVLQKRLAATLNPENTDVIKRKRSIHITTDRLKRDTATLTAKLDMVVEDAECRLFTSHLLSSSAPYVPSSSSSSLSSPSSSLSTLASSFTSLPPIFQKWKKASNSDLLESGVCCKLLRDLKKSITSPNTEIHADRDLDVDVVTKRKSDTEEVIENITHTLDVIRQRLACYSQDNSSFIIEPGKKVRVSWNVRVHIRTYYLCGRYLKLARDVSQSEFTIAAPTINSQASTHLQPVAGTDDAISSTPSSKRQKTGLNGDSTAVINHASDDLSNGKAIDANPNSYPDSDPKYEGRIFLSRTDVESVIINMIHRVLGTTTNITTATATATNITTATATAAAVKEMVVSMHCCGREDMDVRMLGNGRPFCLKVSGAIQFPTQSALDRITSLVSMEHKEDVRVTGLWRCEATVWKNMQTIAEEKHKSYTCLIYCMTPPSLQMLQEQEQVQEQEEEQKSERIGNCKPFVVSDEQLQLLENCWKTTEATSKIINDDINCYTIENEKLLIHQRTPLRVLHRRSLLTRQRHVYDIHTRRLSPHCFQMSLSTSAGTYVKEFVTGDFGRTIPSVSSMLGCRAVIFQLDVTKLHDDLPGNEIFLDKDDI